MNYQKGIQRVFVVLAIGWAVLCIGSFAVFATQATKPIREEDVLTFVAYAGIPIGAGYALCFIAIPWVTRSFKERG
jgi:hypothetical protein